MKQMKNRAIAFAISFVMIVTALVNPNTAETVTAATGNVTIYFVDNTNEKWVSSDNAIIELIDNSHYQTHYTMTHTDTNVWSVVVPTDAYNLTFNRLDASSTTQWNSWSAGGRDSNNTYYADGAEYGHYGYTTEPLDVFEEGDIVYLDLSDFTDWEKSEALLYANFSKASKFDNNGNNISIANAGDNYRLLSLLDDEVEEHIYTFTITAEFAGTSCLRFWRGNSTTLWNDSIVLTPSDYVDGLNCVKVTNWNESGSLTKYTSYNLGDIDTTKDEDSDNVPDYIEIALGMDTNKDDTDEDGLSDYLELYVTGTDPIYSDTDEDGISDGDEDFDSDGLTNLEELSLSTAPDNIDTDNDGLTDYEEVNIYGTNPLVADTDEDGANDGVEIEVGTNPLIFDTDFSVRISSTETDTVTASVDVTLCSEQLDSLSVEKYKDSFLFPETMPGYIGGCYEFSVDGTFDEATIRFKFDEALLDNADFDPVIYYFNEETQELETLDTTITENIASATTTHFSKYILLNRKVYKDSFTWVDNWTTNKYTNVEIVLVIDDSGSMTRTDSSYQRLSVAQTLIDNLPKNSRIGVVSFGSSTIKLTSALTTNKTVAKSYLTKSYFTSGGSYTYMYNAINSSLNMFNSTDDSTLRMMVVLSDGQAHDTTIHNMTITAANNKGVRIHTVGLGSSTNYFSQYMKPIATNTDGSFYLASNDSELADIYKEITEKIDIETDSDADGIPDYYEDNMVMFNGVHVTLDKNNPDSDGDGLKDGEEVCELKYEYSMDKTKVKVTGKVIANPTEVDTDFDGIEDNVDKAPLSNKFKGTFLSYYNSKNASYTFDYRQFFTNSTTFNDAISSSSIVFANAIYEDWGFKYDEGASGSLTTITDIMSLHGFKEVEDYSLSNNYSDDDISEVGIGYHNVTYNNKTITVLGIVVRGTNGTIEEWSSNVDIGDPDAGWNSAYHKGFYNTEQRILLAVNNYIAIHKSNMEGSLVYWVTGHSRGAAIANILSAELIDTNKKVYGYTYASPSVTTSTDVTSTKYNSIFNIKNGSDVVTCVPLPEWGFGTYGISIKADIRSMNLESTWCTETGRDSYKAFTSSILSTLTSRLNKSCASSSVAAYDYSGSQNISDKQYTMISDRALKYCKMEEREFFGHHTGYKLYPSTMFIFQLGMEVLAGTDKEKSNATDLLKEMLNSKYAWCIVLLATDIGRSRETLEFDTALVGDGHAPNTYYTLNNKAMSLY